MRDWVTPRTLSAVYYFNEQRCGFLLSFVRDADLLSLTLAHSPQFDLLSMAFLSWKCFKFQNYKQHYKLQHTPTHIVFILPTLFLHLPHGMADEIIRGLSGITFTLFNVLWRLLWRRHYLLHHCHCCGAVFRSLRTRKCRRSWGSVITCFVSNDCVLLSLSLSNNQNYCFPANHVYVLHHSPDICIQRKDFFSLQSQNLWLLLQIIMIFYTFFGAYNNNKVNNMHGLPKKEVSSHVIHIM